MSTRGDGETVNVRRATVADVATISALNADVQAVHAAALPWLFKTPSAETFPPATAAACSQEMMSWFTSPTSVMRRVSYQVFEDAASAAADGARPTRGAPRTPGDGEICASSRDTLHHLLLPAGDAGSGPRSRVSKGPARVGSRSYSALLRRKDRWPSAIELRGAAGSDDLNEAV